MVLRTHFFLKTCLIWLVSAAEDGARNPIFHRNFFMPNVFRILICKWCDRVGEGGRGMTNSSHPERWGKASFQEEGGRTD